MEKGFTLRKYQEKCINNLIDNYEENKKRNLIVQATGSGKTVVATEFHKRFKPNEPTLFLVDRIELAYQAQESFKKSDSTLRVGIEMNTHHASKKDDVVIACVHSIGRKGSYRIGKFDPSHFQKVIVDEAHISVSDIYIRVLNYLEVGPDNFNPNKMLVGMTATPQRHDGVSLGLIYDDIAYNYDIRDGIKDGYLTDINLIQVETSVDISGVRAYQHDFNKIELEEAINIPSRNNLVLKCYKEISPNESTIVYCNSVEHAYMLTDLFNQNDIPSFCIEAHTKKNERKKAIRQFKRGKIKVLFNYGTLTTGFDAKEVSTIIIARPIKSELLLRQILGRGIRPSAFAFVDYVPTAKGRRKAIDSSNKPYCKVIDLLDIVGDHSIVSIPSLFGLNEKLRVNEGQKFFREVVEPLEEIQRKNKINIKEVEKLDDVKLLVKKSKLNVSSLKTPKEITDFTDRDWIPAGKDTYEITYPDDKKTIVVKPNSLDQYDVLLYSANSENARKLNSFQSLSGAIKLGDDYADRYLNTDWVKEAPWKQEGVTKPQFSLLLKLYKGRIGVSKHEYYEDTQVPKLYDRQLKERIETAGHASRLIGQRIGK